MFVKVLKFSTVTFVDSLSVSQHLVHSFYVWNSGMDLDKYNLMFLFILFFKEGVREPLKMFYLGPALRFALLLQTFYREPTQQCRSSLIFILFEYGSWVHNMCLLNV